LVYLKIKLLMVHNQENARQSPGVGSGDETSFVEAIKYMRVWLIGVANKYAVFATLVGLTKRFEA
jgi:hypothetical protein